MTYDVRQDECAAHRPTYRYIMHTWFFSMERMQECARKTILLTCLREGNKTESGDIRMYVCT